MLFVLGACLGSFLCCQARRIHLREKKTRSSLGNRSVCLSCKYQLKWFDNIPIISWILLRGKCRKCHRKIGVAELLSELGVAITFLALGTTIDVEQASFVQWLFLILVMIFTITICFLAIFDGIYGELPTKYLYLSIILALIILIYDECVTIMSFGFTLDFIINPFLSVLILGGLYLMLYLISKGKWVGNGDWYLATALALVVSNPWLALAILFLANVLASIIMAPLAIMRKKHKIYFGPFLVIAFIIVFTFADNIMQLIW